MSKILFFVSLALLLAYESNALNLINKDSKGQQRVQRALISYQPWLTEMEDMKTELNDVVNTNKNEEKILEPCKPGFLRWKTLCLPFWSLVTIRGVRYA
eukprot:12748.XXX_491327_491684_1 [CDS] Oithona nana genome sequencing.